MKKMQAASGTCKNLNAAIDAITKNYSSEELIDLFTSITVPVSKIQTVHGSDRRSAR